VHTAKVSSTGYAQAYIYKSSVVVVERDAGDTRTLRSCALSPVEPGEDVVSGLRALYEEW